MRGNIRLAVIFAVGFCAIPAQIVILREFLLVFGGNELIIGLFLSVWMLLTALGSFSAGYLKIREQQIPYFSILLSWLPICLLYLTDLFRNILFLPGIEPALILQFFPAFLVLLPFCFLSGWLFAGVAGLVSQSGDISQGDTAYSMESIGSMTGGFLFSLGLVYLYDNFRSAAIVALLGCFVVLFFRREKVSPALVIVLPVAISIFGIIFLTVGSKYPRHFLFRDQELLEVRDTPYGNLAVTRTSGQLNLFENNILLYSTDNQLICEEAVHFALLQVTLPKRVLLISGGIAGLTHEILKYRSVERIDYLEIDPVIFDLGKKYTPFISDKKIRTVSGDPRIFLGRNIEKYDGIIIFLPAPSSFQLNRFYTLEFMNEVKRCLNPGGVFSFSLPLTGDYLNEGSQKMYSTLMNTAKSVFRFIKLFPGQSSYFVASDNFLKTNIGQLVENKEINTDYVNSYYINEAEMMRTSNDIVKQLWPGERMNTDFKPVAVNGFNQHWVDRLQMHFRSFRLLTALIAALIMLGLVVAIPSFSPIFAAGFTSASLQVILILSFQVVFGYIYRSIGLFTGIFMVGLASGAMYRRRIIPSPGIPGLILMPVIMAGLSSCAPSLIGLSAGLKYMPVAVHLLYMVMTFLTAIVTGIIFSISINFPHQSATRNIMGVYGADLAGASLGAFITTLFLIPLTGIKSVPYLTALLNLLVAFLMIIRLKRTKTA